MPFSCLKNGVDAWRWFLRDRLDIWLIGPIAERALAGRRQALRQFKSAPVDTVYIDISVIHDHDAGTGIQRVVRSLRQHLPSAISSKVGVEFLIVERQKRAYVTLAGNNPAGEPGSLFFGLDFATDSIFRLRRQLRDFKLAG